MAQWFSGFLAQLVDVVWGAPLVLLLLGGGLGLFFYSSFLPLKGFFHAFSLIMGKHAAKEKKAEGQLTHFQALSNALAATVGLGNIAGVAVALTQGGPGAVLWMWLAALVGMNTKFYECTLALMYRGKDYQGEVQGGPMYVISQAMPKAFAPAAVFFSICGMIGCMALFQVNQLSSFLNDQYHVDKMTVGVISAVLIGFILLGGVVRIARVSSKLVPSMAVIYIAGCLVVLGLNIEKIPSMLMLIVSDAFTGQAMFGGAAGWGIMEVMNVGVKRAAFSNEAGVGTAPMAHGNAKTNEPVSEGLVAMLGPFLDTMIICTMTALVILITLPLEAFRDVGGITITVEAFETTLPGFGRHVLGTAVLLFSITTMIGMANYNEKCWNFLFKGRYGMGRKTFILFFCTTLIFGAVVEIESVVNLLDIGYGLMAWPNMIATIWLAPKVKAALIDYFKRYKI